MRTPSPRRIMAGAALSAIAAASLVGVTACGSASTTASRPAAVSTTATPVQTPQPALRMVSNHGHKLAFHVTPGHLPAIVLDAGGGADSSYWKDLAPALAKATGSEIITYDRAGMGASDDVPGPWKVGDAVSDLQAGLTAVGATHDVILVSHSEAGEIATYFARANPQWLDGAVLVDASLPGFYTDNEIARIVAVNKGQIAALATQPSTQQTRQLIAVAQDYAPMHRAYHQVTWPQTVPVTVIASAKTPFVTSPADAQRWRDTQVAFGHDGTNHDYILAPNTSHDVPLERPDIVIQAITNMIHQNG